MKISNRKVGFKENVNFINAQSVNRESSIMGEYSTDKYNGVTWLVLKKWTDGNQLLNDIITGIFIYVIRTTEYKNIL